MCKWRITANYYRGENSATSYSFTLTLANIREAWAKREINLKGNFPIEQGVYELAMIKSRYVVMSDFHPLMSVVIKPG
jgi:hypothetical protein